MPTIKQYGPSRVRTEVTRQPTMRDAPAGAFGGAVAQGLGDVAAEYERVQDDISTTESRAALNSFQKTEMGILTNPDNGYYNTAGNNAYSGAQPTIKSLSDLKGTLGKELSSSARRKFEEAVDKRIASASMNINQHAARGYKEWKVSGLNDEIQNNIEEAAISYDNKPQFNRALEAGAQAVYDKATMAGLDPKEATETYRAEFVKSAVLAATATSSAKGEEILAEHVQHLGGEGPTYKLLKDKIAGKKEAEKTAYETTDALVKSTAINDRHDGDRLAIRDEVNAIADPIRRERIMKQSMVEFNRRKTANSEARIEVYKNAQAAAASAEGLSPWIEQNSQAWLSLEPSERQSLQSSKLVKTDWTAFSGLMLLPLDELAEVDPAKYTTGLAESELNKLITAVKSAKKGETGIGRTRMSSNNSNLEILFGRKKAQWITADREDAGLFYDMLEVEETYRRDIKGSDLTPIEYTDMVNGLTNKVKVESNIGQFFGSTTDITDFEDNNASLYAGWLRKNRKGVTIDNLLRARKDDVLGLKQE
jgi:hypothetical protein